jgi:4-hydroxy-tetrahydrodipicolinate synthase
MFSPNLGAYPTMITPYNSSDGSIDFGAVKALVEWYYEKGCAGIFACCQSSEIHMLTLSERVKLAEVVNGTAKQLAKGGRSMTIIASGHVSDRFEEQIEELTAIIQTGVDALILISNRMDIENTGDEKWIYDASKLIDALPDIPLGIYECPRPYKRLLSPKMIDFIVKSGRFAFIKDTCCDSEEIGRRINQINLTPSDGMKPALFNANAQTLLDTLRAGCAGYCGVMCNFHPELYVKLCEIVVSQPERAELLAAFLSQAAFIESLSYPAIAKYHLNKIGIKMSTLCRTTDGKGSTELKSYNKMCVDKMDLLAEYFIKEYC